MEFRANKYYHVYNQGNNEQPIFYESENYLYFLSKLQKLPKPACSIIAYCLMPNHFHLLIYTDFETDNEVYQNKNLSIKIGSLLSSYTKAMNKRYGRSGSLFRSKTKAKCLSLEDNYSNQYAQTCFHYIHQNPIKANLVNAMKEWPYSSYPDYASYRSGTLPNIKKDMKLLQLKSTEKLIKESKKAIASNLLKNIW